MKNKSSKNPVLDAISTAARIKIERPTGENPTKPPRMPVLLILGVLVLMIVYILMRLPKQPPLSPPTSILPPLARGEERRGESTNLSNKVLAKQMGSLFQYVFDHGAFYTQDRGYANREFRKDSETGEVFLEIEYDVFLPGSSAGMYLKSRGLDLSKFEALEFQVKEKKEEGAPTALRLELKSKGQIVRAYAPRHFPQTWRTLRWKFNVREETWVEEMTIVFTHAAAGEHKKGALMFKNFELIPPPSPSPLPSPRGRGKDLKKFPSPQWGEGWVRGESSASDDLDILVQEINGLDRLKLKSEEDRSREN